MLKNTKTVAWEWSRLLGVLWGQLMNSSRVRSWLKANSTSGWWLIGAPWGQLTNSSKLVQLVEFVVIWRQIVHQVDWGEVCFCYFMDGWRRRSAQQWQSHLRLTFSSFVLAICIYWIFSPFDPLHLQPDSSYCYLGLHVHKAYVFDILYIYFAEV